MPQSSPHFVQPIPCQAYSPEELMAKHVPIPSLLHICHVDVLLPSLGEGENTARYTSNSYKKHKSRESSRSFSATSLQRSLKCSGGGACSSSRWVSSAVGRYLLVVIIKLESRRPFQYFNNIQISRWHGADEERLLDSMPCQWSWVFEQLFIQFYYSNNYRSARCLQHSLLTFPGYGFRYPSDQCVILVVTMCVQFMWGVMTQVPFPIFLEMFFTDSHGRYYLC